MKYCSSPLFIPRKRDWIKKAQLRLNEAVVNDRYVICNFLDLLKETETLKKSAIIYASGECQDPDFESSIGQLFSLSSFSLIIMMP